MPGVRGGSAKRLLAYLRAQLRHCEPYNRMKLMAVGLQVSRGGRGGGSGEKEGWEVEDVVGRGMGESEGWGVRGGKSEGWG